MSCFNNLVNIRELCGEYTANYYLNDCGINLKFIERITGSDTSSSKSFVEDKIKFCGDVIAQDINKMYSNTFTNSSYISNGKIGYVQDNMQLVSGTNSVLKGVYIELCNVRSNVDLYINKISLFTDYTGNVVITVYDILQNKVIDTITVPCVSGEISQVVVNKSYTTLQKSLSLLFVYDSTGINSYKTTVTDNCSNCSNTNMVNAFVRAYGAMINNADAKILQNIVNIDNTAGMFLSYSIKCNYKEWLCDIGNLIGLPLLYKTAAEIYRYATMQSERFNDVASNRDEKLQRLVDYYELLYREQLDGIINKMPIPNDTICFNCRDRIRTSVILP